MFQNINGEDEEKRLFCATEAVMYAYCSKEVSLNGVLGECYSLNKSKPFVSEKVVGKGKTYSWYLGSIDNFKTITLVYETKENEAKEQVLMRKYSITTFSSKLPSGRTRGIW